MYWALSFIIIASYMIYSVGFCSKQARLSKPGFTHMWQTCEVSSTLVIPVLLHSHSLYMTGFEITHLPRTIINIYDFNFLKYYNSGRETDT